MSLRTAAVLDALAGAVSICLLLWGRHNLRGTRV